MVLKVPFDTVKLMARATEEFYKSNKKQLLFQNSPFHIIAYQGNLSLFQFAFDRVDIKNPNPLRSNGSNPLIIAARRGHYEICKFIIEHVEEKNPQMIDGSTPLFMAALKGNTFSDPSLLL